MDSVKIVEAGTRKEWRAWLEKNHTKEKKVGLISHKKHTGKPSMSHKESMEEAICFGWIDTTIKRLDEDRYLRYFARRNKNSKWSTATLSYAKDLTKRKLMTPEGTKFYLEGLKKKPLDHGIPKNPDVPEDLKKELAKDKIAKENFEKWSNSYRRTFLRWIEHAKLPETRKKRIGIVFQRAKEDRKKWNG